MLTLDRISRRFGGVTALDQVSLKVIQVFQQGAMASRPEKQFSFRCAEWLIVFVNSNGVG